MQEQEPASDDSNAGQVLAGAVDYTAEYNHQFLLINNYYRINIFLFIYTEM